MDILRIEGLTAGYAKAPAVLSDVDLDVAAGEVVALLGASGSGKSTLLRCIAGLHPLRSGRVLLGRVDLDGIPVEQRGIGLVFQDHALFPHRDVGGNVAFGPRMQRLDPGEVTRRVDAALTSVGIDHLRHRAVDELSGGEQQRVALARALASHPRLLLLDEPYGSLDRPLRERLIAELPGLIRGGDRGALLVTHDQQEALHVADRVAVLVAGQLRQLDTPARIWASPVDADVAAFLDVGPLLDAVVSSGAARGAFGELPLPGTPDGPVRLLIPRTALELSPAHTGDAPHRRPSAVGRLAGRIVAVRFAGDHHRVEVSLGDGTDVVLRSDRPPHVTADGAQVALAVDVDALRAYPPAQPPAASRDGAPDAARSPR